MPEGDTVWLTARRLHAALAGNVLSTCDLRVPQLATVNLRRASVVEVVARGKHLLVRLDSGSTLHSHLKMDGSWYLSRAGTRPRAYPEHLIRAQLGNATWLATGYRVHDVQLVASTAEGQLVGHLGPDLLGPDWDAPWAVRRLSADPARAVAEALLDQRNLAGIGNVYKCELLFLRGVHPWRPVGEIRDPAGMVRLAHRLLDANKDRIGHITTGSRARGEEHWVYGRAGRRCRRCGTLLLRADQAPGQGADPEARITFWCPHCQPES